MPELVFITACKHISLKFFCVRVWNKQENTHCQERREQPPDHNQGHNFHRTSFVCAAAQVMHYSFKDSGRMTAAAMDCKHRMGSIRVISTAIWSQLIALLQLFTALMLYSQTASAQNG